MEDYAVDVEYANAENVPAVAAMGHHVREMHVNVLCVSVDPLLRTQIYVLDMGIATVIIVNAILHGQV